MDLKRNITNLPGNRALSSLVALFLLLCMGTPHYAAVAASVNEPLAALDDYKVMPSAQAAAAMLDPQSMKYLLAEVNYLDGTLNLIDEATGQVISTMKVGNGPLSVMPCPGTMNAAILNDIDNTGYKKIVIVNMTTKEVLSDIYLQPRLQGGIGNIDWQGSVDHMFWRHDGKYLYVITDTFLAVINAKTYTVEKCFDVVGSRVAVDMSPDGSAMLLFRGVKDNKYIVDKLNTSTNQIEQSKLVTLNFSATNVGPLRFSPDGTKAYTFIDDMGFTGWIGVEPNLCIIDNSTLNVEMIEDALPTVKSASRTNRMDLEVSPDSKRLYMLYSSCERLKFPWAKILVYNLENRSYENELYSDSREVGGIALNSNGSLIYAANYCDYFERVNTISIMNAAGGGIIGHIGVDYGPMDVKLVPVASEGW